MPHRGGMRMGPRPGPRMGGPLIGPRIGRPWHRRPVFIGGFSFLILILIIFLVWWFAFRKESFRPQPPYQVPAKYFGTCADCQEPEKLPKICQCGVNK